MAKGKSPFRVIPFENVHIFTLTLQKKQLAPSSHSLDAAPALKPFFKHQEILTWLLPHV